MKKETIIFLISLVAGLFAQVKAQENQGFTLIGQFKGLPDQAKVYLTTQEKDTVATTYSKNGRFIFKGNLPIEGRFHFIKVDTLLSKIGTKAIFLVNQKIVVSGIVGLREITVIGSDAHDEYVALINTMNIAKEKSRSKQVQIELNTLAKDIKIAIEKGDSSSTRFLSQRKNELWGQLDNENKKLDQIVLKWIENHPASLYAPYLILGYKNVLKAVGMQSSYDNLTVNAKASYYGVELKRELENIKLAGLVKQGSVLPDFKISSINQQNISVLEYSKKGKITLIDFWASWCSPCRAEIPNMKKVYEVFHHQGFNIIGVSTDAKEADWRKALLEDNTPWSHGRDNIDHATKNIFNVRAIPAFALIDGDGKLIAFSCGMSNVPSFGPEIRGEGLYKTIEGLLHSKRKR